MQATLALEGGDARTSPRAVSERRDASRRSAMLRFCPQMPRLLAHTPARSVQGLDTRRERRDPRSREQPVADRSNDLGANTVMTVGLGEPVADLDATGTVYGGRDAAVADDDAGRTNRPPRGVAVLQPQGHRSAYRAAVILPRPEGARPPPWRARKRPLG